MANAVVAPRVRVANEAGKGVEALRHSATTIPVTLNNKTMWAALGPWPTDIDVVDVRVVIAAPLVSNGSNTLDVLLNATNGTTLITQLADSDLSHALVSNVPWQPAITLTKVATRVTVGQILLVKLVGAGDNTGTPAAVSVRIEYDIPVYDYQANSYVSGAYQGVD